MSIAPGFETSYRRHLVAARRRAILRTLSAELDPDSTTVGEVVEAARQLGVAGDLGQVSLEDLAREFHGPNGAGPAAPTAQVERPAPGSDPGPKAAPGPARARQEPRGETSPLDQERMGLERAVEVLVPVVDELGKASMHDIEARTGIGRRKLRFHVGQLVKAGHLVRHGMGRGTYYTVS